jgi:hypothetical protein
MHALCDYILVIPNWSLPNGPLLEVALSPQMVGVWTFEVWDSFYVQTCTVDMHEIFIKISLFVFRSLVYRGAQIFQKSRSHLKIVSARRT